MPATATSCTRMTVLFLRRSTPIHVLVRKHIFNVRWQSSNSSSRKARATAVAKAGESETRDTGGPISKANDDPLSAREDQRVLHVAIAGLPNAGKSTLVNLMVGDKVSAVSAKRHTTRRNSMGVMTVGNAQIFFHDTPGFVSYLDRADYRRELSSTATDTVKLVDVTLLIIDAAKKTNERIFVSIAGLLEQTLRSQGRLAVVLNKIDLVHPKSRLVDKKEQIMDMAQKLVDKINAGKKENTGETGDSDDTAGGTGSGDDTVDARGTAEEDVKTSYKKVINSFEDVLEAIKRDPRAERPVDRHVKVFMTSATDGHGVESIVELLERSARPGRWRFEREKTTNMDDRSRATEIVRESLFTHLYKELPYVIEQHTRKFVRHKDNTVFLNQDLCLDRPSQSGIVVGKLKLIHKDVEAQLSKLFGAKATVHFNVVTGKKRDAGRVSSFSTDNE